MSTLTVSPEVNNCKLRHPRRISQVYTFCPHHCLLSKKAWKVTASAWRPYCQKLPAIPAHISRLSCAMTCTTISSTLTVITLTSRYAELFAPSTKPSHDRTTGSKQELERARNTWTRTLLLNLKRINRSIQNNIGRKIYSSNSTAVTLCSVLERNKSTSQLC